MPHINFDACSVDPSMCSVLFNVKWCYVPKAVNLACNIRYCTKRDHVKGLIKSLTIGWTDRRSVERADRWMHECLHNCVWKSHKVRNSRTDFI